jgi:hypothetical protein
MLSEFIILKVHEMDLLYLVRSAFSTLNTLAINSGNRNVTFHLRGNYYALFSKTCTELSHREMSHPSSTWGQPLQSRKLNRTWNEEVMTYGTNIATSEISLNTGNFSSIRLATQGVTYPQRWFRPGLSNAAPVIFFPGALIYSAGFNVNQNFTKKIFMNNSMFQFFRSTPMNTVFPLLQSCF